MDYREQVSRNLERTRAFILDLLEKPADAWPPDGASVVFLPDDDSGLLAANAHLLEERGDSTSMEEEEERARGETANGRTTQGTVIVVDGSVRTDGRQVPSP